jgi:aminopeptidase S
LLLGAHLDRVASGQGVVDNGASCAVLLELIARFRARPLEKTTMTVVFFDLEENGLLGSRNYFQSLDPKALPSMAMNLDIFGYGDTLFVTASKEGPLLASLGKAASEGAFPVRTVPMAQYPSSDHRSMAQAGAETLGIALIDGAEIDAVVGRGGAAPPRILTIIHSDADTMNQIREKDIAAATSILENAIRILDAGK